MLKLKIGDKELSVKYAYGATLKTRLLSKMAKREAKKEEGIETMEDLLLFLPYFLLVGLQKFHADEYGFNYETEEGKEEQIEKMFSVIEDYLDSNEDKDAITLYNDLTEEMLSNGFLKSQFQEELTKKKMQEKEKN